MGSESHTLGLADGKVTTSAYGRPGDEVYVGEWNRDGRETPAVRRGNELHIRNSVEGGPADLVTPCGHPGDPVLVRD